MRKGLKKINKSTLVLTALKTSLREEAIRRHFPSPQSEIMRYSASV